MTTDTSEKRLETLVVSGLIENKWIPGDPHDYDRSYTVDLVQLTEFVSASQEHLLEALDLKNDGPVRQKFLSRLQGEITRRGIVDVLRHGVKHGQFDVSLFYETPSAANPRAMERFNANRFSVTRQLRYSQDESARALDLTLFLNGLPIATFELKNSLTKQTVADAIEQYQRDRDPREKLFELGRCIAHFAVDDAEVHFCTHLNGKGSWFLPFNQGWNDGAGNPPNPEGLKTEFLWKRILTPASVTNILEHYALRVEDKNERTRRTIYKQIFPRYHQLDVVRKLLADARERGAGHRYLIQHSAGSGKSNSIAWLAHQLITLEKDGKTAFDTIVVVTDRRILDQQIKETIRQFTQVRSTVGHAERSGDLRRMIQDGTKIVITTVQKFPFILDDIGSTHRDRQFAIIIDEAHSSQGGRVAAKLNVALSPTGEAEDDETIEDTINRLIESRKLLPNASYFAFTATPKNKTIELFGEAYEDGGAAKRRPFHSYTMKQAIQEGFIVDVLAHYTPVYSWYHLVQTVDGDPEFDTRRANKKLRQFVESQDPTVRQKVELMVDHFRDQVMGARKIGGEARAMVVCGSVERTLQFFHEFNDYLRETKLPYKAIVAFSGERDYRGEVVDEARLNGFPSNDIPETFRDDPYRFLICADKFQTGYDEPLLHTMYVDKQLSGVKAVQTLSRLNRAHPMKRDAFVLDFANKTEVIEAAFADYYRTTVLSSETDPNKLHDLKSELDGAEVYTVEQIRQLVDLYLHGAERDHLDPILDLCVQNYLQELDEDGQVEFKSKAKAFCRTYEFLSTLLPYGDQAWEGLAIFLNLLIPKLPAPKEEDLSKGIIDAVDLESYRLEKRATMAIRLPDQEAEISPVPSGAPRRIKEPEVERLSNILRVFNDLFGNIDWTDKDRVRRLIGEDIPARVSADTKYQNAIKNSDQQNARVEHDAALARVMEGILKDDTQLYKRFKDEESFRRFLQDAIFNLTYFDKPA